MNLMKCSLAISLWITLITFGYAQTNTDTSISKPIIVINADKTFGENRGAQTTMYGHVILRQDSVVIYADTVLLDREKNQAIATGDVTIQRRDTLNAFCHRLIYSGQTSTALMSQDVVLQNGVQRLFSDNLHYNLQTNVASYDDRALMMDRDQTITSKIGIYMIDSALVIFRDSVVVSGQDYIMGTDTLHYHTDSQRAEFQAPMRMRQNQNDIYAEGGYYDMTTQFVRLEGNAQFRSPVRQAKADVIDYDLVAEDILMQGHAWFSEEDREVEADTIDYSKGQDRVLLIGNVQYRDAQQVASGSRLTYIISTEELSADGRSTIIQQGQTFSADRIVPTDITGQYFAQGRVQWADTAQGMTLRSPFALMNREEEDIQAFGENMCLVIAMDQDSLLMTADTLHGFRESMKSDSLSTRIFIAHRRVVGYKQDLQFVADSLVYHDSLARYAFYGSPVIWSDSSQFTADTIYAYMQDRQMSKIELLGEAFIISRVNKTFYNQMKARHITAYLEDSKLHRMHGVGNAESVYYATDDAAGYIGVNELRCGEMIMYMRDQAIDHIRFLLEPIGIFHPMNEVDHNALRLEDFRWIEDRRPQDAQDIFRVHQEMVSSLDMGEQLDDHKEKEQ